MVMYVTFVKYKRPFEHLTCEIIYITIVCNILGSLLQLIHLQ